MGLVDAVYCAAVGEARRRCGLQRGIERVERDLEARDWDFGACAAEVPDLHAAVAAGCGEDAVVCCAGLEADLFEGGGVVAEDGDGGLGGHVDDAGGLVAGGGGDEGVVLGETHVDYGVGVRAEGDVDVFEGGLALFCGLEDPDAAFLVADCH